MSFQPDLRALRFCLDHIVDQPSLYARPAFPEFDAGIRDAVLEAAADLAGNVLGPLNRVGDTHGARLEGERVFATPGFGEAIRALGDGGWIGLCGDPEYDGQGLPKSLEQACLGLFNAANMALSLHPTLTLSAIEALHAYGTSEQKALYLPRLMSGEWSGTMNLTEPQAGSDLAAITAKAEPDGSGGYRITGTKIFITWGEHDANSNIIHLVLARLPDAPAGTRGISLFVCPKVMPEPDGTLGAPNAVRCIGLEHKLGIHGSPTCVMAFEGAQAELVGTPNEGLKAMFVMMNAARLAVGVQGAGVAEAALQHAVAYARERRQGRSVATSQDNALIIDHPDVRRMLGLMSAKVEAARALCLLTAHCIDLGQMAEGDDAARLKRREDFLVPIAKAWATEVGVEVASLGVQVHGGMGFIEETGAAQHYRDARIAPIYEGTNGIQAADLTGRKLGSDGLAAHELKDEIMNFISTTGPEFTEDIRLLTATVVAFTTATDHLVRCRAEAPADVAAGAVPYLMLAGDMIGGWLLLKGAAAASKHLDTGGADEPFIKDRVALARIYARQVLGPAPGRLAAVLAGYAGYTDLNF